MKITTPGDLANYLISISRQHPRVNTVVYGEHSRSESATLARSEYPQIDIETPEAIIPPDESIMILSTRVYVVDNVPGGEIDKEDLSHEVTYQIARDLVNLIRNHSNDAIIEVALTQENITITPIISMGSDQRRGWQFQLSVEVEQDVCDSDITPDALVIPSFTWSIDGVVLKLEDTTITGDSSPDVETKYWKSSDNGAPAEVADIDTEISIGDNTKVIELWQRTSMPSQQKTFWQYACIDVSTGQRGRSLAFIPRYPI